MVIPASGDSEVNLPMESELLASVLMGAPFCCQGFFISPTVK